MNKKLLFAFTLIFSGGALMAQQAKQGQKQALKLSSAKPIDAAKRSASLQNLKYVNLGQKPKLKLSAVPIYTEDFDGISGPTAGGEGTYNFAPGFLLRNVDNRTPDVGVAYFNNAWERGADLLNNEPDSAAFSTSWYTPAGAANDWMWTPLISGVNATSILSWNAVAYDGNFPDGYQVRIMTAAQGPPTGGNGAIGNQLTGSTLVFSTTGENATWTNRFVSLATYAGQSVYIGFRNNSNNRFMLAIDDIAVDNPVSMDAQVIEVDTVSQYTQTPLSQKTNLNLGGVIRNSGTSTLTNVALKVNVYNSANTIVATATSATVTSIASFAQASFTIPNVSLPNTLGAYRFKFVPVLGAPQVELFPANDTLTWTNPFEYTPTTYARDNGVVTSGFGIGEGNGGYLGQSFNLVNAEILKSVTVRFNKGYTGRKFAAVIYSTLANDTPNAIIGYTDTLLFPDDSARTYSLPIKGGSLALPSGTYVVAAIEFDSTLQLSTTNSIFTPRTLWLNWPTVPGGTWINSEIYASVFSNPFFLRPEFKIKGDNVCDAITLSIGANGPYRHDLATVEPSEVAPPSSALAPGDQSAWYIDGTGLTNSIWFKFTATTKKVRIAANWAGNLDDKTQLALWKANSGVCGDLLSASTATLLAANDDSSSTYFGSVITGSTLCLTPGATYYVQVDASRASLGANVGDSLFVNLQPIADVTPSITGLNAAYCIGSPSITLDGTPAGGTFTVNNSASATYTPLIAGTDSIKYTIGSCYTATQAVTVNANPAVNIGGNQSTCDTSLILDAGNSGSSYVWSNGATTQTITVSSNGNYSVTVTNANTCSSQDSAAVTFNSVLVANLTPNTNSVCEGDPAITLVGAPAGGTYSANALGGSFNPSTAGIFTASYIVSNVCGIDTANAIITVNANPVSSLTAPFATLCTSTPVTLTGLPVGGVYTVVSGAASSLVGNVFNAASVGTYTIAYTSTNGSGCSDSAQFNFNVNCILSIDALSKSATTINIYPNPNSGQFTINSTTEINGTVELINELGQVVYKENMKGVSKHIKLQNISTGIYHLKIVNGQKLLSGTLNIIR